MEISKSAKISPNTVLVGNCKIGNNVLIYGDSYIDNCDIGDNTTIWSSALKSSHIGADCTVGPFAHIREGCDISNNVRIGNFVEVKKSTIGSGSKLAHLTYVGDANIGQNCNIGCGVIFCNYDGKVKHKTTVGDNVFIGSNCNLVAPLNISSNSFIAAGTTVTKDVEKDSFVIGRVKQINKQRK